MCGCCGKRAPRILRTVRGKYKVAGVPAPAEEGAAPTNVEAAAAEEKAATAEGNDAAAEKAAAPAEEVGPPHEASPAQEDAKLKMMQSILSQQSAASPSHDVSPPVPPYDVGVNVRILFPLPAGGKEEWHHGKVCGPPGEDGKQRVHFDDGDVDVFDFRYTTHTVVPAPSSTPAKKGSALADEDTTAAGVARPCRSSAHNGDDEAVGSWVAAVKVVSKEVTRDCDLPPHMIRSFLAHRTLQTKLQNEKYKASRYTSGTTHKKGPNVHKEKLARHKAEKMDEKLKNIHRHIKRHHHLGSQRKLVINEAPAPVLGA